MEDDGEPTKEDDVIGMERGESGIETGMMLLHRWLGERKGIWPVKIPPEVSVPKNEDQVGNWVTQVHLKNGH